MNEFDKFKLLLIDPKAKRSLYQLIYETARQRDVSEKDVMEKILVGYTENAKKRFYGAYRNWKFNNIHKIRQSENINQQNNGNYNNLEGISEILSHETVSSNKLSCETYISAITLPNMPADINYSLPPFHQTLLAHELTLKRASSDMRKIESPLSSAMVDLQPHQIDAAVFAFKGPMSKGAILCDEVGLGKTIEAGLIISQLWAEGKRKIIVIVPASIRKQWQNEMLEKFGIPCVIVDGFEYRQSKKNGLINPFDRDEVVIVSIPFAAKKSPEISAVSKWDLIVIDEAHRLRNVYKKNGSKQAKKLKEIFAKSPKVLLTATSLQNTLMELYGLVSFIDDRFFGSEYAFNPNNAIQKGIPVDLCLSRHHL
jgi:SNF2 family DNA or RNA helicase